MRTQMFGSLACECVPNGPNYSDSQSNRNPNKHPILCSEILHGLPPNFLYCYKEKGAGRLPNGRKGLRGQTRRLTPLFYRLLLRNRAGGTLAGLIVTRGDARTTARRSVGTITRAIERAA